MEEPAKGQMKRLPSEQKGRGRQATGRKGHLGSDFPAVADGQLGKQLFVVGDGQNKAARAQKLGPLQEHIVV